MSDFREWVQHPCTIEFRKEVEKAISEMHRAPRLISESVESTALMNAKAAGFIEGLDEIAVIIDELIEVSDDD